MSTILYEINKDVQCLKCGNKGAVQSYGKWYPKGLGDKVDQFETSLVKNIMEKHRNNSYMSMACGYGGTIPWECMNCGNTGLVDMGGLELYKQAFETIKEK
jgi:hypothetical protein